MKPRLWPLLLSSFVGIAILCWLGTWQVQRLAQKTALIAALESRMAQAPITIEQALAKQKAGEDIEYLKVTFTGDAHAGKAMRKITSSEGDPAWEIITPFTTSDGYTLLIDSGAMSQKNNVALGVSSASDIFITGVLRNHNKGQGFFDGSNDVTNNIWYWWDVPTMLQTADAPKDKTTTLVVQKLPAESDVVPPFAQAPKVELNNNHLGYAITWFGLAAALASVSAIFAFSLIKKTDA